MLNFLLKKKHKRSKIYNKTKKKKERKSTQKGKKRKKSRRKRKKKLKYKRITKLGKRYMNAQIEDMKIRTNSNRTV